MKFLILAAVSALWAGSAVATPHEWSSMTPGANAPGVRSLEQQCHRSVRYSGWTKADCQRLALLAKSGQCRPQSIAGTVMYRSMTTKHNGVWGQTRKPSHWAPVAQVCVVGPGKVAHWFTGYAQACNNLGIVQVGGAQGALHVQRRVDTSGGISVPGMVISGNTCCCQSGDIRIPGVQIGN